MELWCVKDLPKKQEIKFSVQTLYNLRLKKHSMETVFRDHSLPYRGIWSNFGLIKLDLTRTELHLITHLYLNTLSLFLPTMELNKGDDEDSENEEKALIQNKHIETVTYTRRMVEMKDRYLPATLSLLGCENNYLGIKVTLFDPLTVSDTGFFLTIDQTSWVRTASEKEEVRKKDNFRQD